MKYSPVTLCQLAEQRKKQFKKQKKKAFSVVDSGSFWVEVMDLWTAVAVTM